MEQGWSVVFQILLLGVMLGLGIRNNFVQHTLYEVIRIEVILTDTAGIRESQDFVEKIGVDRAYKAAENAHIVLFVLDMSRSIEKKDIELYNHIKLKPHSYNFV